MGCTVEAALLADGEAGLRVEEVQPLDGDAEHRRLVEGDPGPRVEALGSSLLAYFPVDASSPRTAGVTDAIGGAELGDVPLVAQPGTTFCATFETRTAVRSGHQVEVVADVERLHFFDPETERAIAS